MLVPHGRIAAGKMAQAVMHGAEVIQVRGGFDECLQISRELAEQYPVALVNSVNPMRLQGQKTAAFEIIDALGHAPDVHVLPVGNAGNISAYWIGFKQYEKAGLADRTPQLWGFQAAGAAPLVLGEPVANPETVASAIRIGNPASWLLAESARDDSRRPHRRRHRRADPRRAARAELARGRLRRARLRRRRGRAARRRRGRRRRARAHDHVTVTGHGLKDIDTALAGIDSIVDSVIDVDVREAAAIAGLA